MQRLLNLLFSIVITLSIFSVGFLMVTLMASADEGKDTQALRNTSVMVSGVVCTGSGSIVEGRSGKHYLLTNSHVCNCAKLKGDIYATFEGGQLVRARVVKQNWRSDLCAARVEDSTPALKIGLGLIPFTEISTRGYPGGRLTESHGLSQSDLLWDEGYSIEEVGSCPIGSYKIYGLNGNLQDCVLHTRCTLTNLYVRPGASGSAVVNKEGKLVGVVSSWHTDRSEYYAGMVPFTDVRDFLDLL